MRDADARVDAAAQLTAVAQVVVAFEGEGSGTGPMAWGQADHYAAMVRMKTWSPLGGVKRLLPGTTVDEIADELRWLISRYQTMRTLLRPDAHGRVQQVVFASGEITLEVFDAGEGDPEQLAEAVCDLYRNRPLDFAAEWPVRMAVIRKDGELTHMSVLMCHLVCDAAGAVVMMTEVAARESAPVSGLQPLAQAEWQNSPSGRRHNDAALRHWEGILRAIDPRRFPEPTETCHPRYWEAELVSPALLPAVRAIANRTQVDESAVVFGLYAAALAQVTGINPVVFRPLVNNRFRPGLAEVVCTAVQSSLCMIDAADGSFDDTVKRAQRVAMTAYKYGYFDPDDVVALTERVRTERGMDIDVECFINDRRSAGAPAEAEAATPADIRDALARTTFAWTVRQDGPAFEQLCMHIDDAPDAILLTIQIDGARVSRSDAEAMVRAMESIAVAEAFDFASTV